MIALRLKAPEKILEALEGHEKIVLFGDSGCAQLCDVGGLLQLEDMEDFLTRNGKTVLGAVFVEGGICNGPVFRSTVQEQRAVIDSADALLVQACGVAVQTIVEHIPEKEAFPAADSMFLGVSRGRGTHSELCAMCGDCILHLTGGICPLARCAKGILNGPCGGSMNGKCERDEDTDCAWQLIYDRLRALGKLDNIRKVWEMKDWRSSHGPRVISHHGGAIA